VRSGEKRKIGSKVFPLALSLWSASSGKCRESPAFFAHFRTKDPKFLCRLRLCGGGRGIRTPGTLSSTAVFKTACFNRSHIPPHEEKVRHSYCKAGDVQAVSASNGANVLSGASWGEARILLGGRTPIRSFRTNVNSVAWTQRAEVRSWISREKKMASLRSTAHRRHKYYIRIAFGRRLSG
jgi:hypothetical protein